MGVEESAASGAPLVFISAWELPATVWSWTLAPIILRQVPWSGGNGLTANIRSSIAARNKMPIE